MKPIVRRVVDAGLVSLLEEVRSRYSLGAEELFLSNHRPAPEARAFFYVRLNEKGWTAGRIAKTLGKDRKAIHVAMQRWHERYWLHRSATGHWLLTVGPYVDGLLAAACVN
jgi:hypothetical protein